MAEPNGGHRAWQAILAAGGALFLAVGGWTVASVASAQTRLAVVEARQERAAQDMDRLSAELRETRAAIADLREDLVRTQEALGRAPRREGS